MLSRIAAKTTNACRAIIETKRGDFVSRVTKYGGRGVALFSAIIAVGRRSRQDEANRTGRLAAVRHGCRDADRTRTAEALPDTRMAIGEPPIWPTVLGPVDGPASWPVLSGNEVPNAEEAKSRAARPVSFRV